MRLVSCFVFGITAVFILQGCAYKKNDLDVETQSDNKKIAYTEAESWFRGHGKIQVLSEKDISELEDDITAKELIQRFGKPWRLEIDAYMWPKHRSGFDLNTSSNLMKVAYGYWFFFEEPGRIKSSHRLKYVLSLKGIPKKPHTPLFDMIEEMTIDWPVWAKGKQLDELSWLDTLFH